MRVAHVFNMANNGYQIVKALRKYTNLDVDLIVDSKDFGMALPIWEDYELNINPYDANPALLEQLKMPDWVRIFHGSKFTLTVNQIMTLFRMVREYDLLHLHPFSPLYLQFQRKPFIIHEAGWLRALSTTNTNRSKLGRRAYAKAESIVMTNPDLYKVLPHFKHKSDVFIPFVIDTEQYRPQRRKENSDELVYFAPARHVWDVKGNDKLIKGFARYLKDRGPRAKLILVNWGTPEDISRSKQLIKELNIDKMVQWVNPLSKPLLINMYNRADAVLEEFVIGGYGTAALEAMACGCPVVMYFYPYWNVKCYGEAAPVLNAFTEWDIAQRMVELEDAETRIRYGKAEREYVIRHHDPYALAKEYVEFYEQIGDRLIE